MDIAKNVEKKKAGEWYIRLENEFRNNEERCRFITLTLNKKSLNKYIELARKEIEEKKKIVDTKKGIDVRNIACKIAVRRWLEIEEGKNDIEQLFNNWKMNYPGLNDWIVHFPVIK